VSGNEKRNDPIKGIRFKNKKVAKNLKKTCNRTGGLALCRCRWKSGNPL